MEEQDYIDISEWLAYHGQFTDEEDEWRME